MSKSTQDPSAPQALNMPGGTTTTPPARDNGAAARLNAGRGQGTPFVGQYDLEALRNSGYEPGASHTYIIEAIGQCLVKIGKTSDVHKRLSVLQVGCPFELRIVAWLVGDVEGSLHELLSAHHVRGEWFRYVPEVDRLVTIFDKVPIR